MARTFTFGADGTSGNAASALLTLFAGSVYPLAVRLTNYMPRAIAIPVAGVYLESASSATGANSAVFSIASHDIFARFAGDVEQIAEINNYAPAMVVTDDVEATGEAVSPDVVFPVVKSSKNGYMAGSEILDLGGSSASTVTTVSASRALAFTDNGNTLIVSAAGVTITVPEGLATSFGCVIKGHSGGTTVIDPLGTVTINGATTNITIAASKYVGLQCPGALNVFDVVGV